MFLPLPPPKEQLLVTHPTPYPAGASNPPSNAGSTKASPVPSPAPSPPPSPLKMYGAGTPIPIPDEERLPARSLSCTGSRAGSARSSENGSVKERKEGFFARM